MVLITDSDHLMCQLEGRRGPKKGSSLSSTHVPAIRLQQIFPPLKREKKGAYYTIFKKRQLLLVSFLMITAEETGSATKQLNEKFSSEVAAM